ncbi:MAG: putative signal transducing protein [Planctomycetota bacterium]|jgi:hypothetical protein
MARKSKKAEKQQTKVQELVVATFARDLEEAHEYESLLKNNDIPTAIKEQNNPSGNGEKAFAVMVPEENLDEALVVIESQDAYDEFYDFTLDSEGDEFEDDYLDDVI